MRGFRWIVAIVGLMVITLGTHGALAVAAEIPPGTGVSYAPVYEPAPQPPLVGIKAEKGRRIRRGAAALIVAWVSPCRRADGQLVRLLRNGRPNGSKYLGRACTVRFYPRVRRGTVFTVELVPQDEGELFVASRWLRVKIKHRRR